MWPNFIQLRALEVVHRWHVVTTNNFSFSSTKAGWIQLDFRVPPICFLPERMDLDPHLPQDQHNWVASCVKYPHPRCNAQMHRLAACAMSDWQQGDQTLLQSLLTKVHQWTCALSRAQAELHSLPAPAGGTAPSPHHMVCGGIPSTQH